LPPLLLFYPEDRGSRFDTLEFLHIINYTVPHLEHGILINSTVNPANSATNGARSYDIMHPKLKERNAVIICNSQIVCRLS
jgi:hypothetical protein